MCRNDENSKISKEEKDWMIRQRNYWRITAKNENVWRTKFRNYENEMRVQHDIFRNSIFIFGFCSLATGEFFDTSLNDVITINHVWVHQKYHTVVDAF